MILELTIRNISGRVPCQISLKNMPNNFNKYIKKHKKRSAVIKMVKFLLLYCYRIGNVKAKNSAKILTVVLYRTSAKNAVPHLPGQRMLLIMKKNARNASVAHAAKYFHPS